MTDSNDSESRSALIKEMITAGKDFYRFGWLLATSGNMSCRSDDETVTITATGRHLRDLTPEQFIDVDMDGKPSKKSGPKPSGDTDVHLAIYRALDDVGTIYHLHHLEAALCSDRDNKQGFTHIDQIQMLYALGVEKDETSLNIPILGNPSKTDELATSISEVLGEDDISNLPCLNIHNHGLYVWGETPSAARRHVEACAYLFEYSWKRPMNPKKSSAISGFGL